VAIFEQVSGERVAARVGLVLTEHTLSGGILARPRERSSDAT